MGLKKIKNLEFNLSIVKEGNIIFLENKLNSKDKFQFSLEDNDFENLEKFINYILENIEKYDNLLINYSETNNNIHNELMQEFKKTWEEDFKKIKSDIHECEINKTKT